jgi:DNA-binding transcriptional LysR family regulator
MHYTLHQLQVFLKIVETKSVTKAAEELRLTQPAISIQLKNFQAQFEIALTEVTGRKIHITDFGNEVAQAAKKIIEQVQAINQKSAAYQGLLSGKIKISVVSTGKYVLPFFLTDFMQQHPGVEFTIDVTNKNKVVESIANNEVDLALVSIVPATIQVEKLELLQNKLYLVGKPMQPSKKKEQLKELFDQLPLIYRENGSGTRQVMESFIEKNRLSVTKKMELTSNEAVKQALLAGLGYSIMPLIGLRNELLNQELEIITAKGFPIKTTWSLIWLKGKNHSQTTLALLQYLKEHRSTIVSQKFSWYENY